MRAFLAMPDQVEGPRPGVVVIHEVLGLGDDIRRITARFAENGYVAFAPDLFDRPGPQLFCVARAMLAFQRRSGTALRDLECATQHLAQLPEVDGSRIGVAGFCMGGGFALLLALTAKLQVAAPFYGSSLREDELRDICPVVGSYGGRDSVFAPEGRKLKRRLERTGVAHDVKIYDDAGHSFMSQHEPTALNRLGSIGPLKVGYDPEAAEDAWQRMLGFFAEHLGE